MNIKITDFKYLFDGNDATLAVQEAVRLCGENPGATLDLCGETLHFYGKYAFEKEYYVSNNDYSKKSIIFPLLNMKDITVDGKGAELLFHGEVVPFVIDGSENVVLKDFKVDYPQPFFFQADIVEAGDNYIEVEFDTKEFNLRVKDREMVFFSPEDKWEITLDKVLVTEFDSDKVAPSAYIPPYFIYLPEKSDGSFLEPMYRFITAYQLSDNKIRFEGEFGHHHIAGNKLVCTLGLGRKCPGIFGTRSKDIVIKDVTLYQTAAMGVICQLCENVTLEGVKAMPREGSGRFLSVSADATHFVNCWGTVRYEGCKFVNMLDDAGNIHGIYTKFVRKTGERSVLLTFGHYQQRGLNLYDEGDVVHIADNRDMTFVAKLTVKKSYLISGDFVQVEFYEELPELLEGFVVENRTKMPELYINGCESGYNRPRGFLPTTWKKTVITNNVFYNMVFGLHFAGDSNDWFESGPVNDVLIKGNKFKNAAYAGGAAIQIDPHVLSGKTPYHRNIVIEDNEFEMHEERFLYARFVEGLVFRNNTFIENPELPAQDKIGENGIDVDDTCVNCVIEDVL
ncbi:MAG: right-handed parallel beta-helix repeat-containing protein [Clostridia bacterium]|nr:right-handed parallel beta-helix repeat-containing protein [Clostridia bacterium]